MACAYRDSEAQDTGVVADFAESAESPAITRFATAEKLRRVEDFLAAASFFHGFRTFPQNFLSL